MGARLWGTALLGFAVALAGCDDTSRCQAACPVVGDSYAIVSTTFSGGCAFAPPVIPPTVTLTQTPDGRVSLTLIDPANQQPFALLGELRVPDDPGAEYLASFSVYQTSVRQASFASGELDELQFWLSGAISEQEGYRLLNGSLSTSRRGEGCTARQTFLGRGAALPTAGP